LVGVKDQPSEPRQPLLARVRCLDCGNAYAKPSSGGTVERNPGCPRCGYIGWIDVVGDLSLPVVRNRSASGLQPLRPDRPR
jgi:hypothetical protein